MRPILLLLCLTGLALGHSSSSDPIPAALGEIQPRRLMGDVEKLVGFHTRHTFSETKSDTRGIGAARRWLRRELKAISKQTGGRLQVREQRFAIKARGQEGEGVNVYGFLPGRDVDEQGRTYIVCGHYDSRGSRGMDAEVFAPGADDDASGTAVVLELARIMAGGEYSANLIFLCVPGEEQGLFGSKHFAKVMADNGVDVDGMLTNDIVGGIEGGNGVVDPKTVRCFSKAIDGVHSPSRSLARSMSSSAARYVEGARLKLIFRLDRFGRGGDHIPFDELGYPAARMTEANEFYARQHQNVREDDEGRFGDLAEHVSGDYMALVTSLNAACLAELALAPAAPAPPRIRAALSYHTRLSWTAVPAAASYEVVWRSTTSPDWEGVQAVPAPAAGEERVAAKVEGISADSYFFGVRSVSESGHRSRVIVPKNP